MCGRYASFREAQDLADAFAVAPESVAPDAGALPPSWNVAPTDPVRVVVERERAQPPAPDRSSAEAVERSLRLARWGLVPGWAKDPSIGARMINARLESLAEKPAFRRAAAARRCLVPAEGYYEWQRPPEGSPRRTPKQPYWIHADDGGLLAFAGLYEFWRDPAREDDDPERWLVTTTIVTAEAPVDSPELAAIHDRRPVVVDPALWADWLDPALRDANDAVDLLRGTVPTLVATTVSTQVNSVANDGPELIAPQTD